MNSGASVRLFVFLIMLLMLALLQKVNGATKIKDICNLDPDPGPCRAFFPTYFWNKTGKFCDVFVYGGCDGNDNAFDEEEDCIKACGKKRLNQQKLGHVQRPYA